MGTISFRDIIDLFTKAEMLPDREWSFFYNSESEEFNFVARGFFSGARGLSISISYYRELILACKEVLAANDNELSNSK